MIAGLRGTVEAKRADALLVDVGGVIYRVGTSIVSLELAGEPGDPIELKTHLVVREDLLALYGFVTDEELLIFETLIGVSGIGPRLACAVLSHLRPDVISLAIASGDVDLLATAPGIGKKTAARLIVELQGKLPDTAPLLPGGDRGNDEVLAALRSLGYTLAEAHTAMVRLPRDGAMTVEERVVAALNLLSDT